MIHREKNSSFGSMGRNFLQDETLSWKAKGILSYLLTLPGNWHPKLNELVSHSSDGNGSLYSGIKELIEHGYIIREIRRDEKKRISEAEYHAFESQESYKEYKLKVEKQEIGNLNEENQTLENRVYKKNKSIDKEIRAEKEIKESFSKKEKEGLKANPPQPSSVEIPHDVDPYDQLAPRKAFDFASPTVKDIVSAWNSSPALAHHRETSAVMDRAVREIEQVLKSTEPQVVKDSILAYASLLSDQNSKLNVSAPGHKVGLDEFFRFSRFTQERMKKCKVDLHIRSWFDELKNGNRELWMNEIQPREPKVYERLKAAYGKKFLGSVEPRWSRKSLQQFIIGSNRLLEVYDQVIKKFLIPETKGEFVDTFLDALRDSWGDSVVPGHVCSNYSWDVTFPQYLVKQAIIRSGEEVVV